MPTPMTSPEKLTRDVGNPLDSALATRYRSLVGGLQYLTLTRPNISFNLNMVYQYLHSLTTAHYTIAKRILHYVSGTLHYSLKFDCYSTTSINAFSYAD